MPASSKNKNKSTRSNKESKRPHKKRHRHRDHGEVDSLNSIDSDTSCVRQPSSKICMNMFIGTQKEHQNNILLCKRNYKKKQQKTMYSWIGHLKWLHKNQFARDREGYIRRIQYHTWKSSHKGASTSVVIQAPLFGKFFGKNRHTVGCARSKAPIWRSQSQVLLRCLRLTVFFLGNPAAVF